MDETWSIFKLMYIPYFENITVKMKEMFKTNLLPSLQV